MNISLNKAFLLAVLANVVGGFIVVAVMSCHHRMRYGTWMHADGI